MDRAERLYRLQQLEDEEERLRRRLAQIEAALGETPALRQARQTARETAEEARQWGVRQQDLELQVSALKQKIADSERRLYSGSVRNPKELSDLQAEVASLKRRLERTEETLLEAMIAREEAEAAADQARQQQERAEAEWAASQEDLLGEKERLEDRLEEVTEARAALLPSIPAEDLRVYQGLRRTKGGLAVALVRGGACTGCGMEIPSGRLQRAREGGLFFCGNCERVLLFEK